MSTSKNDETIQAGAGIMACGCFMMVAGIVVTILGAIVTLGLL